MTKLKVNPIRLISACLHGEEHMYQIVKGSGAETGTPTWKCKKCRKITKSN